MPKINMFFYILHSFKHNFGGIYEPFAGAGIFYRDNAPRSAVKAYIFQLPCCAQAVQSAQDLLLLLWVLFDLLFLSKRGKIKLSKEEWHYETH